MGEAGVVKQTVQATRMHCVLSPDCIGTGEQNMGFAKVNSELCERAGDEVEEAEALEVLGLLVAVLHDLVVALPQRLHTQPVPDLLLVQLLLFRSGNKYMASDVITSCSRHMLRHRVCLKQICPRKRCYCPLCAPFQAMLF